MRQLSKQAKETIVLQALNRQGGSLESIVLAHAVPVPSLIGWVREYEVNGGFTKTKKSSVNSKTISRQEQFNHILATSSLDEVSLGQYCREHGIFSHQLGEWRELFMKAPKKKDVPEREEIKKLHNEIKLLQRELLRKDKALAEASALLVLKKKANLIWGVDEEN